MAAITRRAACQGKNERQSMARIQSVVMVCKPTCTLGLATTIGLFLAVARRS